MLGAGIIGWKYDAITRKHIAIIFMVSAGLALFTAAVVSRDPLATNQPTMAGVALTTLFNIARIGIPYCIGALLSRWAKVRSQ